MKGQSLDIVNSLIELGLSEREAKVYRVLLGIEEITAAAIPKFTDVPRTKVYEVLTSLQKKGFCRENFSSGQSGSGAQTYSAMEPKLALEALMRPERQRLNELEELSNKLGERMQSLYTNSSTRLSEYEFIEVLKGGEEIIQVYNHLRKNAKGEILEMSKGDYAMPDEEAFKEADANSELIASGVNISVIYEQSEIEQSGDNYFHTKNHELGVKARMTKELPFKLSLFGCHTVMLPLSDPAIDEPNMTALIVEHPAFYKALRTIFELYWNQAMEIDYSR